MKAVNFFIINMQQEIYIETASTKIQSQTCQFTSVLGVKYGCELWWQIHKASVTIINKTSTSELHESRRSATKISKLMLSIAISHT